MKITRNPFVATLGITLGGCEFPKGSDLTKINNKYFWETGYNNLIQVDELQIFDDFGIVRYEITFP